MGTIKSFARCIVSLIILLLFGAVIAVCISMQADMSPRMWDCLSAFPGIIALIIGWSMTIAACYFILGES